MKEHKSKAFLLVIILNRSTENVMVLLCILFMVYSDPEDWRIRLSIY